MKLGDFGLARIYRPTTSTDEKSRELVEGGGPTYENNLPKRPYSHQVATRWYRAPELLYASRHYDFAVDVWSAGAIVAELMLLRPLFCGSSDIDQMAKVFQIMGTPNPSTWAVSTNACKSLPM